MNAFMSVQKATGAGPLWLLFVLCSAQAHAARDVCLRAPQGEPVALAAAFVFQGEGNLFAEAMSEAKAQFASALSWPSQLPFPDALASNGVLLGTCVMSKGSRVRVSVQFPADVAADTLVRMAKQEKATLETLSFLATHESLKEGTRFSGGVSLRQHMSQTGRVALPTLLSACQKLAPAGCSGIDPEAEARALGALNKALATTEFEFEPEDDVARSLFPELETSLGGHGVRVRQPTPRSVVVERGDLDARPLKTRCQRVVLPGVEGQNLRIVELACEADAFVKGEHVATMRFSGRGQDLNHDDAVLDARRRLVVEEFAFKKEAP